MTAPALRGRVLPTLNADGTRRLIRPRLYVGRTYRWRRSLAIALMALFVGLPFVRVGGKPAVLLDVARREFTLFGTTFLPTDGVLLMLLLLTIFVFIIWMTALVGRAWCGYACPQTVYMEFLFRPIERLFDGPTGKDGRGVRRVLKYGVFAAISVVLGNVFLAYFVGTDALAAWVVRSPLEHPGPFVLMAVTSGLVFVDFAYFREQMCTIVCPYARLQSVLLDRRSLVVGYDARRGEPRSKGKPRPGNGDCIDCGACVAACPTGIDIRQGLQMECIACAQCVDACNFVMNRIKKPEGLIRYGSQEGFETGSPTRLLRPRVVAYALALAALLVTLFVVGASRQEAEITILRGAGEPFTRQQDKIVNQVRLRIDNHARAARSFRLELADSKGGRLVAPENPLRVRGEGHRIGSVFVISPESAFTGGERRVELLVHTEGEPLRMVPLRLLGPIEGGAP
ncbi:MAG: cytochrome c oxidase accessory protein CcoG [Pseudomonadota bacterium]|nr:MAG: cytochrome c oxidase accessory protein CcoG [Pseudomonadota bacterium]